MSSTLFVGNVPSSATDAEVRTLFGQWGPLSKVDVHAPVTGFAYVTYESMDGVHKCLHAYAHREIILHDRSLFLEVKTHSSDAVVRPAYDPSARVVSPQPSTSSAPADLWDVPVADMLRGQTSRQPLVNDENDSTFVSPTQGARTPMSAEHLFRQKDTDKLSLSDSTRHPAPMALGERSANAHAGSKTLGKEFGVTKSTAGHAVAEAPPAAPLGGGGVWIEERSLNKMAVPSTARPPILRPHPATQRRVGERNGSESRGGSVSRTARSMSRASSRSVDRDSCDSVTGTLAGGAQLRSTARAGSRAGSTTRKPWIRTTSNSGPTSRCTSRRSSISRDSVAPTADTATATAASYCPSAAPSAPVGGAMWIEKQLTRAPLSLDTHAKGVVLTCMRAVLDSPAINNAGEFRNRVGMNRETLRRAIELLAQDTSDWNRYSVLTLEWAAMNNSMLEVRNGTIGEWRRWMGKVSRRAVETVYESIGGVGEVVDRTADGRPMHLKTGARRAGHNAVVCMVR